MAKMGCAQCGKMMKNGGLKKKAAGGTLGKVIPPYSNDPRTQQGRMLKNGGIKKAAYGMAMDSVPMTNTTVAKPKKPRVGKVTDKARVGMAITNAPVKHNPPVGKRHNASHTGYVSVAQKRKGGMTKKKMADGGTTKRLTKAQPGLSTGTPFQNYLKTTPGAVASDTVVKSIYSSPEYLNQARTTGDSPRYSDKPVYPSAKNPKNQKALDEARDKTYGTNRYGMEYPNKDETIEQYMRRMGPLKLQKKGGAKMAKGGATKAKKFAALAPPYNKATAADRIAGAKKRAKKK